MQEYSAAAISLPPQVDEQILELLQSRPGVQAVVTTSWPGGRHPALELGLKTGADLIHYTDFDRLLRWVERKPDEWRASGEAVLGTECLVFGRSERAYQTHPQGVDAE
jgi:hypothetical protein